MYTTLCSYFTSTRYTILVLKYRLSNSSIIIWYYWGKKTQTYYCERQELWIYRLYNRWTRIRFLVILNTIGLLVRLYSRTYIRLLYFLRTCKYISRYAILLYQTWFRNCKDTRVKVSTKSRHRNCTSSPDRINFLIVRESVGTRI